MPIRPLAPDVVSKIAAGEVVERPASVVKELVENSLDAGASQVNIEVKAGGMSSIRVWDNGVGMPGDEVDLAFQRHATSKIASLADLDSSTSLGFRGEALPSIAHVAEVELVTRTREEMSGTCVRVRDGTVVERGTRAHPEGTAVTVRHLFRNVPARLKYLKSPSAEAGQITALVSHYALAFPEVRFSLVVDGRRALQTSGNGKLRDVLAEVYGVQVAQAMLEVGRPGEEGGGGSAVSGYVSPSSVTRANRSYITFFVNRRWIQSRMMTRAVEKAYEGLLAVGRYPVAVISLSLPPQTIDVNVHPAKREIRFAQESIVFNSVYGAVRRTLMEKMPVPEIGTAPPSQRPVAGPHFVAAPINVASTGMEQAAAPPPVPLEPGSPPGLPPLRVLGQSGNTYIVAEGPDGLYLIDQHAAHERVVFEEVLAQQARRGVEVQSLLEPLAIDLSLGQEESLRTGQETLAGFGFAVEPFGDRACLVRAVPAVLAGGGIAEALKEILDRLQEEPEKVRVEEKVAITVACHSAVRAGQRLSHEEMVGLVRQLEKAASPRTCPHGRPTMVHLSSGQLQREFGRT
ncbi:MAG: DNA mismatch repair endonuclease MutL [Chloroflexi bacterium]|nr:MAG: DNA mismatch repair endonuclease MutL [Chloroflexota bacterium]